MAVFGVGILNFHIWRVCLVHCSVLWSGCYYIITRAMDGYLSLRIGWEWIQIIYVPLLLSQSFLIKSQNTCYKTDSQINYFQSIKIATSVCKELENFQRNEFMRRAIRHIAFKLFWRWLMFLYLRLSAQCTSYGKEENPYFAF